MIKIHSLFILALSTTLILTSCKPKEEVQPDEPTPTPEPIAAINVLNTTSGFSTVFESAHSLGGINNANSIKIGDFTLETNNRLNVAYYTEEATQQSPMKTQYRYTKDLTSNQFLSLPAGVGQNPIDANTYYDKVSYQYFPYSNIYCISTLKYSTGFGYNNTATFANDVYGGASSPNPIGSPDLCFRYPVMNSGASFGYFCPLSSVNQLPVVGSSYGLKIGAIGSQVNNYFRGGCLHDIYTGNGIYDFFAIGITMDSVKVYKLNYGSFPTYTPTVVNSLPTTMDFASTTRHYSADGKILSFMCTDLVTQKVSTYIYNFQTNTLTQNLNQVTLDYAGTGSDIDLDENGDVYYTGYANNGSNTNGVSVYKKSGSGASTLVGSDNILLYGTVLKLRILMGKVYLAITGKQSGKEVYQISIVKQN